MANLGSDTTDAKVKALEAGSVSTEYLYNGVIYAGNFDGETADDRLDNAIESADDGVDTIWLEPDAYTEDRTIDKELVLLGSNRTGAKRVSYLDDNVVWTVDSGCTIERVGVGGGGEIEIDGNGSMLDKIHLNDAKISVKPFTERVHLTNINGFGDSDVTFEDGSELCVIDSSVNLVVDDVSGDNLIGDVL